MIPVTCFFILQSTCVSEVPGSPRLTRRGLLSALDKPQSPGLFLIDVKFWFGIQYFALGTCNVIWSADSDNWNSNSHNPLASSTLFDVVGGNLEQMLQWRSRSNSSGWPSSFCDSSEFKNVPKAKKFQKQSSIPRVPRKNWNIEGVIVKHSSSNSYYSVR